ncbi:helix-turn-helix domain-containing protein [Sulfuriferula sp.]|uniref:helix-turn-helix domain-containing protein n=1 Tax=Sulfuriferula sp. TaxID=2025307 RepID=UPI0027311577|nr:helix-turn-helix domain-containing protein [Sulfuriferula sp.]MDP2025714.1 helix-turn-helix domain-containing protein [Sulfuriferula sp.]
MVAFAEGINMHYPVMTEQQVAARWKVSLKTMRRWRQDKVGPAWYKLFHSVRYHEADVFDFEQQSAQHWLTILGDRERVPRIVTYPPKDAAEEINVTQVRRLMRLTLLAPAVVEQLVGTSETALEQLMRCPWPTAWKDQIRLLAPTA